MSLDPDTLKLWFESPDADGGTLTREKVLEHQLEYWAAKREEWASAKLGVCDDCQTVHYRHAVELFGLQLPIEDSARAKLLELGYEPWENGAGFVKRCERCRTTEQLPWIRDLTAEQLMEFAGRMKDYAWSIDLLASLLPEDHPDRLHFTPRHPLDQPPLVDWDTPKPKGGFELL